MQVFCESIISMWPMANLPWFRGESQNTDEKPQITLSTPAAPDGPNKPRYVLDDFQASSVENAHYPVSSVRKQLQ